MQPQAESGFQTGDLNGRPFVSALRPNTPPDYAALHPGYLHHLPCKPLWYYLTARPAAQYQ
jgi:hypothetical protein